MIKKILFGLLITTSALAFTPPKVVTATIGFAPGSGNEISFREVALLAEKNNPGLNFIINNKPGADEIIGLDYFGKLEPRGDNIYIVSQNNFGMIETWFPGRLKYNLMDLALVTGIAKSPLCIVATASSPTSTPKELLDRIKNTTTPITFGLGSAGQRIVFEYIMEKTHGNADQVKSILYKGPGPVMQDLAGGQIEFAIVPTAVAAPIVKTGRVKFIAITSEHKLALIPNVPLMKDYVKDLNFYAAWGIALPIGSTPEQIEYYKNLFVPVIQSQEAKEYFDNNMMITFPDEHTPEGFKRAINASREKWLPYIIKFKPE